MTEGTPYPRAVSSEAISNGRGRVAWKTFAWPEEGLAINMPEWLKTPDKPQSGLKPQVLLLARAPSTDHS